jgi:hypothetical protein
LSCFGSERCGFWLVWGSLRSKLSTGPPVLDSTLAPVVNKASSQ